MLGLGLPRVACNRYAKSQRCFASGVRGILLFSAGDRGKRGKRTRAMGVKAVMGRNSLWILLGATVSVAALAGCQDTNGGAAGAAKPGATAEGATQRVTRPGNKDVEAPEVFSASEKALWDGRPSLGGVWIASPDASGPERVLMTNTENGKTITGALFRRERENPGPRLQLSSDAAGALGVLAGQPATVKVVALRREEIVVQEASPAPAEAAAEGAEKPVDGKPVDSKPAAGKAGAKAAPAAVEDAGAIGAAAVAAVGKDGKAAAAPAGAEAPAAAEPVKQKKGLFGGLFGGGAKKQPKAEDPGAPLSAIDPAAASKTPAKAATVATTPLDGAKAAPAPAAATGSVRIMIGAFGVEANAKAAAAKLQGAGLTAAITSSKKGDKTIFTVTASGAGASADLLAKVKSLGYADAYVTK
jgi:rare lipoprotein A